MNPKLNDTAILIFSRSAAEEAVAKPLTYKSKGYGYSLALELIRHARHIARKSGMKVFYISGSRQRGSSFAARFTDAFEQLFEKGYERVISIGNDCPGLQAQDLLRAAEQLEEVSSVFGPAADGGAYLIALRRDSFDRDRFQRINWQTSQVLDDLKSAASGSFCCLDEKQDIDTPEELGRLLMLNAIPRLLKIRLLRCFHLFLKAVHAPKQEAHHPVFLQCRSQRGPPRPFAM